MATDLQTDLAEFHQFVGEQLRRGETKMSPEASVAAFRAYKDELERLRQELAPSLARAARGEGKEIDFDDLKRRLRERSKQQGFPE